MTGQKHAAADAPEEPCAVCGEHVVVDGEHAGRMEGRVICGDCISEPVAFRAKCERFDCGWAFTFRGREPERRQVENLVRSEANSHERHRRVLDGDHGHTCTVTEIDPATLEA